MGKFELGEVVALFLGAVIVVVLFGCMIYSMQAEHAAWEKYKQEHGCVIAGYKSGDSFVMSDGTVGTMPSKTRWLCDEGKTEIWR